MIPLIILAIAFGGLVEIVPLYFQRSTTEPVAGLKPYTPVQLAGALTSPPSVLPAAATTTTPARVISRIASA